MLTIGTLLQDRYRIENVLGQGGMGSVYLATHVHLDREVAIKQLYSRSNDDALDVGALRQFKHEALLLQSVTHPRLPAVYDYIEIDGCPYLIMEYVRGRSLGAILESGVRQSEGQVHRWALALCEVLEYLHGRTPPIIFRDMKPSNVMLDVKGQIKLIDFGIAKLFDPSAITKTFAKSAGSPGYSAPEQYSGTTDIRSDMYSLGATLYACLAGKAPPPSVELAAGVAELPPLSKIRPELRREFADAIHWCMQIKAMDRPKNVEEAHQAFLNTRSSGPVPEAQPAPKGEAFATEDAKSVSVEATTPQLAQESNLTSPATLGASETNRLVNPSNKLPPPPPTPAPVRVSQEEEADADDRPVLGRGALISIVGVLAAAVVAVGIYNMHSSGSNTPAASPPHASIPIDTPAPVNSSSAPPPAGGGLNAYSNVTGQDDGASFQYNAVRERIVSIRDYTLQFDDGAHRYGYRCVRPGEVRTEVLRGSGTGSVAVSNNGKVVRPGKINAPFVTFSVLDGALRDVQGTTTSKSGTETVDGHECTLLSFSNGTTWDVDPDSFQIVRIKKSGQTYTFSHLQVNSHPTIGP